MNNKFDIICEKIINYVAATLFVFVTLIDMLFHMLINFVLYLFDYDENWILITIFIILFTALVALMQTSIS